MTSLKECVASDAWKQFTRMFFLAHDYSYTASNYDKLFLTQEEATILLDFG